MRAAVIKKEVESVLQERFGNVFERYEHRLPETLPTGIRQLDEPFGGLPRGAITEIYGPTSAGRTSLLLSTLAAATANEEVCALIDCNDTFDVSSAAKAGVDLKRLLWVRCRSKLERAFKAADLVSHAGGFGFVIINLCDVPAKTVRRIISSWWFRFRRAIENTPTVLLILSPVPAARSCASLALALKNEEAVWVTTQPLVSGEPMPSCPESSEEERPLTLVRQMNVASVQGRAHSRFLQMTPVRVNRERPLGFPTGTVRFHIQSHANRGLEIFADIR